MKVRRGGKDRQIKDKEEEEEERRKKKKMKYSISSEKSKVMGVILRNSEMKLNIMSITWNLGPGSVSLVPTVRDLVRHSSLRFDQML